MTEEGSKKELSYNSVVTEATQDYLRQVDESLSMPEMERELVWRTRESLIAANVTSAHGLPKVLEPWQAAEIVTLREVIRVVRPREVGLFVPDPVLAVWSGPDEGVYMPLQGAALQQVVRLVNPTATRTWTAEFCIALEHLAPQVDECVDPNFSPLANGIYDYQRRVLRPYDSSDVFLAKAAVSLPSAEPDVPQIDGNSGLDMAAWLAMVAPEDDVQCALIQAIGAALRWNIPWELLPVLVSPAGRSADMISAMVRSMLGPSLVGGVPLGRLTDRQAWKQLAGIVVNVPSRNQTGQFPHNDYELAAAMGTRPGDRSFLNLVVADELPTAVTRDPTMLDHLLVIPLEDPGTADDHETAMWLRNPAVLEWLAYEALVIMPPYGQFDVPQSLVAVREALARSANPVAAFWDEYRDRFASIFLPFPMLFAAFESWHWSTFGEPVTESPSSFTRALKRLTEGSDWGTVTGKNGKDKEFTVRRWFRHHEPVLKDLPNSPKLDRWIGKASGGPVPQFRLPQDCARKARGLVRLDEYRSHLALGTHPVGNP